MAKAKQKLTTTYEQSLHWGFWAGVVFFVLVIVAIVSTGVVLMQRVSSEEVVPVTSVVISGEMPYTQKQDIEQAIEHINLGNFFKLDVNQIQQQVEQLPWVYSVAVRKKWPDELKIYVVDQTPVAFWNGDFLLNKQGVAFQADSSRIKHSLPAFYGPEGSELIALENFGNLSQLLAFNTLAIDELVLTERYAWQLTLNDGVILNLGREDRVKRIQRFMDVYSEIKAQGNEQQQIEYIDLRYDTGLAVGWKKITENKRV